MRSVRWSNELPRHVALENRLRQAYILLIQAGHAVDVLGVRISRATAIRLATAKD
jgi:hypothetical protein